MRSKPTCAALLYDAISNYVANECNSIDFTFEYNDCDGNGICKVVVQNASGMSMVCDITEIVSAIHKSEILTANAKIKTLKAILKAFGEK